ncbi:MAG: 2-dehydro-3-deoxy-6-phosphogalactonate aldolase [Desulfocapsaceae bacterium]|nr:2-dehydro-3-deoxy-6-phosphogalactonate aldolase [Desulfocapsaceae bacterium]
MKLKDSLREFPFIAITRGLEPHQAVHCIEILIQAGFTIIENPLNSPRPFESIQSMAKYAGEKALIGAGTVTKVSQVELVKHAGGRVIVSPHCDIKIIKQTKKSGLVSIPGVATPTEAMVALNAGADALKLFPAEIISPAAVKAIRAVLPAETLLILVGGINSTNWQTYSEAGASGFGIGSSLYKPGISGEQLLQKALLFRDSLG